MDNVSFRLIFKEIKVIKVHTKHEKEVIKCREPARALLSELKKRFSA